MSRATLVACLLATLAFLTCGLARAGPPFLTDDPDPVPYQHWEFYAFSSGDQTRSGNSVSGPAVEINNGVAPNLQLHLIAPYAFASQGSMTASGFGDIEAGAKFRFAAETFRRPEAGIFPLVEIPTGDASRGLGNGRTWFKLPLWLEKNWGSWTTYGGGGYACNPAPGQLSYFYGGDLIQRTISPRLSLGGEIFLQGATAVGGRAAAIYNFGGQYNFTPDLSLLFSAGHSFQGQGNAIYYLALYRTWGPGSP